MTTLSNVAATALSISTVASAFISTLTTGKEVFAVVASAMQTAEDLATGTTVTGESKLQSVLAFLKAVFPYVIANWTSWEAKILAFITNIKAMHNALLAVKTAATCA